MQILLTGASGFLGQHLLKHNSGHTIHTLGKSDEKIKCNLASEVPELKTSYNLVIHCAGKAHSVPKNKEEALEFKHVNYYGTRNLVKAFESEKIRKPYSIIFISTVAVYGLESGQKIKENHPLNGNSPYALSKILAENYLEHWCRSNSVDLTILRLPLVVGKNAPGNLMKMRSAIEKGKYFRIGKGAARKSVVLADDVAKLCLEGYLREGVFNLTDGNDPKFKDIENAFAKKYHKRIISIPSIFIKLISRIGDLFEFVPINSATYNKITSDLTFDDSKARKVLNYKSRSIIDNQDLWV